MLYEVITLLNLLQRKGGNIVYAATGDGLGRGIQRLEARLDNPWNREWWRKASQPIRRMLGKAAVVFIVITSYSIHYTKLYEMMWPPHLT